MKGFFSNAIKTMSSKETVSTATEATTTVAGKANVPKNKIPSSGQSSSLGSQSSLGANQTNSSGSQSSVGSKTNATSLLGETTSSNQTNSSNQSNSSGSSSSSSDANAETNKKPASPIGGIVVIILAPVIVLLFIVLIIGFAVLGGSSSGSSNFPTFADSERTTFSIRNTSPYNVETGRINDYWIKNTNDSLFGSSVWYVIGRASEVNRKKLQVLPEKASLIAEQINGINNTDFVIGEFPRAGAIVVWGETDSHPDGYAAFIEYFDSANETVVLSHGQGGVDNFVFEYQENVSINSLYPYNDSTYGEPIAYVYVFKTTVKYTWPHSTCHNIYSGFGSRIDPITGTAGAMHFGIDISCFARPGAPITASISGTVVTARDCEEPYCTGFGRYIAIKDIDGAITYYAHLNEVLVSTGQQVKQGQLIGREGTTGNSTGYHLHFAVQVNGQWQDPCKFVDCKTFE